MVCLDTLPNDHSQLPPLGGGGGGGEGGANGDGGAGGGDGGGGGPRTATERMVQRIWTKIVGSEQASTRAYT